MPDVEHFHRPTTVQEALDIKREQGDNAAFLSGGTLLNSLDRRSDPAHLISLDGLELDSIERTDDHLRLGAGCTLQGLLDSDDLPGALRDGCLSVENRSVRNMATLGGYLAGADSTRDLLPILVALEAEVELAGAEAVSILDYLADPGALVLGILIPLHSFDRAWALARQGRTGSAPAAITAAATVEQDGDLVVDPILALGGVAETVVRLPHLEKKLHGFPLPETGLEEFISEGLTPAADIKGSSEYKRHLAGALGARVLRDALAQKGGAR